MKNIKIGFKSIGVVLALVTIGVAGMLVIYNIGGSLNIQEGITGYAIAVDTGQHTDLLLGETIGLGSNDLYPGDEQNIEINLENIANNKLGISAVLVNGNLDWAVDCSKSTPGMEYDFNGSGFQSSILAHNNMSINFIATVPLDQPLGNDTFTIEISRGDPEGNYTESC